MPFGAASCLQLPEACLLPYWVLDSHMKPASLERQGTRLPQCAQACLLDSRQVLADLGNSFPMVDPSLASCTSCTCSQNSYKASRKAETQVNGQKACLLDSSCSRQVVVSRKAEIQVNGQKAYLLDSSCSRQVVASLGSSLPIVGPGLPAVPLVLHGLTER